MNSSTTAGNGVKVVTSALFMSILGALMAFTSLSTDIYLPAMPAMAHELNCDAEYTITGFLVGFAIAAGLGAHQ